MKFVNTNFQVLDLLIAKEKTQYFSPNTRAAFIDWSTNQIHLLNCRETKCKTFYSEVIYGYYSLKIIQMPYFERRYIK